MPLAARLEKLFKWIFLVSLTVTVATSLFKDVLPDPDFYANADLGDPVQTPADRDAFSVNVNGQTYVITPRFDYELEGVVVSLHDADSFTDITHFQSWKDFINLRDLCVIWGENLRSGVYRRMDIDNDSWTCWFRWSDPQTGRQFRLDQASNNHLLTERPEIQAALLSAEPGDHIRLRGMLVEYANPANGFRRGTSTTRKDTGNGACETIYLTDFHVVQKANPGVRKLHRMALWITIFSLIAFVILLFVAPPGKQVR